MVAFATKIPRILSPASTKACAYKHKRLLKGSNFSIKFIIIIIIIMWRMDDYIMFECHGASDRYRAVRNEHILMLARVAL